MLTCDQLYKHENGYGAVGGEVDSDNRIPRLKSRQILLTINCIKSILK